ncbi:FMN reductase [Pontibacillus halophilus JSM 076056 = DSM 19796]|uniref:FMN reductase n=1 Tax=Pontibacillus halophilus JSM 076056 = DSM 19796 TaxID=1385510 RepID=A0A0A5GKD8_9BACI|nr:oxygen-insensitive NADPH nitroreductase [Pontibacillus halophilus]KGX91620.1 FMN reductase [Pontibacillus halophilus JSM 076056 = DSM 19796]
MNETIETILNHRSIRSFTDEALTNEQIDTIVETALMASTSSFMHAYSIIGITDQKKKDQLAEVSGQHYVKENGHMMIFCADLSRFSRMGRDNEVEEMKTNFESTEHLLVSSIDAALAAQNAAIAAESMGLGICYIGSLRNDIARVDSLLELPQHVIPLFGMVFGHPNANTEKKPRLPKEAVYHENRYDPEQDKYIEAFDKKIAAYYAKRKQNARQDTWSDQMTRRFKKPIRLDVTDYVQRKGFNKR